MDIELLDPYFLGIGDCICVANQKYYVTIVVGCTATVERYEFRQYLRKRKFIKKSKR